ncbi:hypothetical protein [Acetobacterium sp.]|uniref:hypothetical protein n=1 Tax=Acetobacterium sp. TaxID=1872094 RepID=UPI00359312EE
MIRILWASVIPFQAYIGEGTVFGYQGLQNKGCHISQNVTLGGTSNIYEVPVLGDNVSIGTGANIKGPVHVGNNIIVGAGAVILNDLPDICWQ